MEIKEEDFILTPSLNNAHSIWDLQLLVSVKPKGGGIERQEFRNVGYGLPIELAIKTIANYRVLHRNGKNALIMKEYLKQYIDELNKLDNLCHVENLEGER